VAARAKEVNAAGAKLTSARKEEPWLLYLLGYISAMGLFFVVCIIFCILYICFWLFIIKTAIEIIFY
jgi:hypothetical protein